MLSGDGRVVVNREPRLSLTFSDAPQLMSSSTAQRRVCIHPHERRGRSLSVHVCMSTAPNPPSNGPRLGDIAASTAAVVAGDVSDLANASRLDVPHPAPRVLRLSGLNFPGGKGKRLRQKLGRFLLNGFGRVVQLILNDASPSDIDAACDAMMRDVDRAAGMAPVQHSSRPNVSEDLRWRRSARMASLRLQRGQLRKAMDTLTQRTLPKDEDAAWRAMQTLHPQVERTVDLEVMQELYGGEAARENRRRVPTDWYSGFDADLCASIIMHRKAGVSPGPSGVTNEVLRDLIRADKKLPGRPFASALATIIQYFFQRGRFPQSWLDSHLVAIPKGKTDPKAPDNYRPIAMGESFMYVAMEGCRRLVFTPRFVGGLVHPTQHGVGVRNGVEAHTLAATIALERDPTLHMALLDVSNAFNEGLRGALWHALHVAGVPTPLVQTLEDIYSRGRLFYVHPDGRIDIVLSKAGVRQGCPLAGTLFAILFDPAIRQALAVLQSAESDNNPNLCPTAALADDLALFSTSLAALQQAINKVQETLERIGLSLNPRKCQLLVRHAPLRGDEPHLTIKEAEIPNYTCVLYLGVPLGNPSEVRQILSERARDTARLITELVSSGYLSRQETLALVRLCLLPRWTFTARAGAAYAISTSDLAEMEGQVLSALRADYDIPEADGTKLTLPIRLGGLGLYTPSTIADVASVAGVMDVASGNSPASRFVRETCFPEPSDSNTWTLQDGFFDFFKSALERIGQISHSLSDEGQLHFFLNNTPLESLSRNTQAALFEATSQRRAPPGAALKSWTSAALSVLPTPDMAIPDAPWIALVHAHLGIRGPLPTSELAAFLVREAICPLCGCYDLGAHYNCCSLTVGSRTTRHNLLVACLAQILAETQCFHVREPCPDIYALNELRRPDLLARWFHGVLPAMAIDVQVTVPPTDPTGHTSVNALRHLEALKYNEYTRNASRFPPLRSDPPPTVIPFLVTNEGHVGPRASALLRRLAQQTAPTPDTQSSGQREEGLKPLMRWRVRLARALGWGLVRSRQEWSQRASGLPDFQPDWQAVFNLRHPSAGRQANILSPPPAATLIPEGIPEETPNAVPQGEAEGPRPVATLGGRRRHEEGGHLRARSATETVRGARDSLQQQQQPGRRRRRRSGLHQH